MSPEDYMLYDKHYKNSLAQYSIIAMKNLMRSVISIRIDAIKYVKEIDDLLGERHPHSFEVNGGDYAHWNGKYHFQGDTVQFDNDGTGMKWFNKVKWEEVYPLSSTKFHLLSLTFCQFVKDENGEINGISFQFQNSHEFYQKIKEED